MKAAKRLRLSGVSEEMKAWSAALAREIGGWPHVLTRGFFGFTALYRKEKIFAVVPRTRAWENANSIAFKLDAPNSALRNRLKKDARVGSSLGKKAHWFTFELSSDADLHDAIDWLGWAYEAAGKSKKSG